MAVNGRLGVVSFLFGGALPAGAYYKAPLVLGRQFKGRFCAPLVETVHDFVYVCCWSVLAWKVACRSAILAVRCAMCRRLSSGVALVSPLVLHSNGERGLSDEFVPGRAVLREGGPYCDTAGGLKFSRWRSRDLPRVTSWSPATRGVRTYDSRAA